MKTIIKILCVLTLVFGLSSCGYERIDAGYEGIKVNSYRLWTILLSVLMLKMDHHLL